MRPYTDYLGKIQFEGKRRGLKWLSLLDIAESIEQMEN